MSASDSPEARALTKDSLRDLIIAGARRVIVHRDQLDTINVFPVPDRDTGTNLAMTMRAILDGLQQPLPTLAAVGVTVASSALTGAQGNSGVIFAQFFEGLREEIPDAAVLTMARFVRALKRAATRAREALAQPRDGTILTVINDVAEHLAQRVDRVPSFGELLDEGSAIARRSLQRTTDRLAELKRAGVVDAGALGFVHFLEGIRDFFRTGSHDDIPETAVSKHVAVSQPLSNSVSFRYCTEAVIEGDGIDRHGLMEGLRDLGDSIVVAGNSSRVHAHVHSNVPAYVLEHLSQAGTIVKQKVEDMLASIRSIGDLPGEEKSAGIALVTDSVCDLPMGYLTGKKIHVVPVRLAFGDQALRDRVDITATQFYERLEATVEMPRTSQPAPADLLAIYRHLAATHEGILSVHVSSALSGTLQSAQMAARQVSTETGVPISVIDSRSASAAQGLVVWAAAEAIQEGLSLERCAALARSAAHSARAFIYVPSIEYFVRGGRLSPLRGRIVKLVRILPILTVADGALTTRAKVFGKRVARERVLREALRVARRAQHPVFIVSHSAAPDLARSAQRDILAKYPATQVWITETTPAIGCHAGPGGLAVAVLDAAEVRRQRTRQEGIT